MRHPVNGNSGARENWDIKFRAEGTRELEQVQTLPYKWLGKRVVTQLIPNDAVRVVTDDGEALSEMKLDGLAWELEPAEQGEEADAGDP